MFTGALGRNGESKMDEYVAHRSWDTVEVSPMLQSQLCATFRDDSDIEASLFAFTFAARGEEGADH